MSAFEKLSAMGADVVGGDLIYKHKVLGHFRDGDLHLTEEGQKMLEIDDAVVKEDAPTAAKPAARAPRAPRAPRAAKTAAPTTAPVDELPTPDAEPEIDLNDE